jgi:hypothetical protein
MYSRFVLRLISGWLASAFTEIAPRGNGLPAHAPNLTEINVGPVPNGFPLCSDGPLYQGRLLLHDLRPLPLDGLFPGHPGSLFHNPRLWRRWYCEALGGILVEFLVQQNPMDAECFGDPTAIAAALV